MKRTAFLGRFQPLHKGHEKVIENHLEESEDFLLVVGSASKSREEDNPFSLEERKEIIKNCFPDLQVLALEDEGRGEEDDRRWAEKLEEKTEADLIVSGNDLVQRLVKGHTSMEVRQQEMYDPDIYSGTEIRRRIRAGEEWRYLVPDCARKKLEDMLEIVRKSGIDYDFKPGWKKENAYHDTADS